MPGNLEEVAVEIEENLVLLSALNHRFETDWPEDLLGLIRKQKIRPLKKWLEENKDRIQLVPSLLREKKKQRFAPLYRKPRKIWGIGLNYVEHAEDLDEKAPSEIPASFVKTDTTIIGSENEIKIPKMSQKTTGEAELGIIIGKECKGVEKEGWKDVVAGFTTIIDMTAEDILRKNPRYLTVSKNFDTFFSFGPCLITTDELPEKIGNLKVFTVLNGKTHAENTVSNMTFPPDFLVSFHSQVMTLKPGDIISTGTPGAVHINDGDIIECRITGLPPLKNNVVDLKEKSD